MLCHFRASERYHDLIDDKQDSDSDIERVWAMVDQAADRQWVIEKHRGTVARRLQLEQTNSPWETCQGSEKGPTQSRER